MGVFGKTYNTLIKNPFAINDLFLRLVTGVVVVVAETYVLYFCIDYLLS